MSHYGLLSNGNLRENDHEAPQKEMNSWSDGESDRNGYGRLV